MIRSFLKIALRVLARQKLYSAVNIVGLGIGLAACLVIAGHTIHETSFEDIHINRDRIYRVAMDYASGGSRLPSATNMAPLGPALESEFPAVERATVFRVFRDLPVATGESSFRESKVLCADDGLLDVFTLPLVRGDSDQVLAEPGCAIISESFAGKYFGGDDPVGQTLTINGNQTCRITGVMRNIPHTTQIQTDLIISFASLRGVVETIDEWGHFGDDYVYLLLRHDADPADIEAALPALVGRHLEPDEANRFHMFLQPLKDIYFNSKQSWELQPTGDLVYVYVFGTLAVFILILACVNFINLSTARTTHRLKEIGVRKTLGAPRAALIRQFLGESVLMSCLAMGLALALFELVRPAVNGFFGRELIAQIYSSQMLLAVLLMVIVVGLLAGSYPAFWLSRMRPVHVFKGGRLLHVRSHLRRVLVVFQFAVAVSLIAMTLVVYKQIHFFRTADLGFNPENVYLVQFRDEENAAEHCKLVKEQMRVRLPEADVTGSHIPIGVYSMSLWYVRPETNLDGEPQVVQIYAVDDRTATVLEMELVQGRDFTPEELNGNPNSILINETAVKSLELENPVGARITTNDDEYTVIGVLKDFHARPLTEHMLPVLCVARPDWHECLAIRLPADRQEEAAAEAREMVVELAPGAEASFSFYEDEIAAVYSQQDQLATLMGTFALLAVVVACLGIFGLASFAAERRTREIGIRSVFGASAADIVSMLTREFVAMVLIANIVAWPIAYYGVSQWLQTFAYRTNVGVMVFALAALLALTVSLLTVGVQALRAARSKPVEALRYE